MMAADFTGILICFMLVSVLITVAGVYGAIACAKYTMNGAQKIGKDIAAGLSEKVQRKIIRDLDTGQFDYNDGWIRSSKDWR